MLSNSGNVSVFPRSEASRICLHVCDSGKEESMFTTSHPLLYYSSS